jgi:hypothetical protein
MGYADDLLRLGVKMGDQGKRFAWAQGGDKRHRMVEDRRSVLGGYVAPRVGEAPFNQITNAGAFTTDLKVQAAGQISMGIAVNLKLLAPAHCGLIGAASAKQLKLPLQILLLPFAQSEIRPQINIVC